MKLSNHNNPFYGIYAATVCPMYPNGKINEPELIAHFTEIINTDGIKGVLVNGHAGEGGLLSREELITVLTIARKVPGNHKVIAGINTESSEYAAELAKDAAEANADAVMVFPCFSWSLGADPLVILGHHKAVAEASKLPLFLFQGSVNAGKTAYSPDLLEALLSINDVVGIKEGSWETAAYESTLRLTKKLRPDVAVMASGDEHLMTCFTIGSEGSMVSLAAIIPDLIVSLDKAIKGCDLKLARLEHNKIYDISKAIYGPPGHLATLRLKTCLKLMGKISSPRSRLPILHLSKTEVENLQKALLGAEITIPGLYESA